MNPDLLASLVQFGAAGLIGLMWLTERRAASDRDRQISDLHNRLMQDRGHLDACLTALRENTRALTSLESTQRHLADAIARVSVRHDSPSPAH